MIGHRFQFAYGHYGTPDTNPDYSAHRGATVTVLRQCTRDEVDDEAQPMFVIRADDGWEGWASESELIPAPPASGRVTC